MGSVLTAYDAGVKASTTVNPQVDAALIALGREIANQIDYAVENLAGAERTKALYLTPHLVNILKEMGATPLVRSAVAAAPTKTTEPKTGGKLASVSSIPRPTS